MIGKQLRSSFALLAIVAMQVAGKPPPPPDAPWAKFVTKPAFTRSLGPPPMSGIGTFSIPYVPKPMMFPKFVDPRMMINKKADLLANLFGGLGPAMEPPGYMSSPSSGYTSPSDYTGMYGSDDVDIKYANSVSPPSSVKTGDNNLPISYTSSGFGEETDNFGTDGASESNIMKRGFFGPMGPKSFGGPFGPKFPMSGPPYGSDGSFEASAGANGSPYYKRGLFGPLVLPFSSPISSMTEPAISQKDKSAEDPSTVAKTDSSTDKTEKQSAAPTQGPPPSYPGMHVIPEENEIVDKGSTGSRTQPATAKDLVKRMITDPSTVPKEYLPGMFGPMGPMYGPPGAFAPPGIFGPEAFTSKKSMFLDTLFKNLATSTPPPATTDLPIPKSTIVPPGFWLPESVVPDPSAYNAKVATFLEKLFDSLKLNASTTPGDGSPLQSLTFAESISAGFPGEKTDVSRSLPSGYFGAGSSSPYSNDAPISTRSLADPEAVVAAKDQIVNSIIGELGVLKDNMMSTFNDFVAYQKNVSTPPPSSKPFKPFVPPFWPGATAAAAASDIGTLAYKRRMLILDQVFDMLTELQTNVTAAVNDAMKASFADSSPTKTEVTTTPMPDVAGLNISVLDAIQTKLNELNTISSAQPIPKYSRALPASPTSFWVAYPGGDAARRGLAGDQEIPRHTQQDVDDTPKDIENLFTVGKDSRAIKMQMHQGYQSLPPGTIESIQAGGGSVPGHEGGGVKLLGGTRDYEDYKKWQDWSKSIAMEDQNNHHRHNHH